MLSLLQLPQPLTPLYSMAKDNNLTDFLADVADAIREKKGTTELINPQDFASEIASIEGGGGNGWTGHADAEGLRAIGWTEEDIAYYQENGVDWDAEDDHLHLVSDDNKALYGVLTADNISTYKDRIVYLPKIDTSALTSMTNLFKDCHSLVAIPTIDTSKVTQMGSIFANCYQLRTIAPLELGEVKNMSSAFSACYALRSVPPLPTKSVTAMTNIFANCNSLRSIPMLDTSKVVTLNYAFNYCYSLEKMYLTDVNAVTSMSYAFNNCTALRILQMRGSQVAYSLNTSRSLAKESLLYLINNVATDSDITITLSTITYDRYATDADVVEALANHSNVTLAK